MGFEVHKLIERSYGMANSITYSFANLVPTAVNVHRAISAVHSTTTALANNLTLRAYMAQSFSSGKLSVEQVYLFETRLWQLAMRYNGQAVPIKQAEQLLENL